MYIRIFLTGRAFDLSGHVLVDTSYAGKSVDARNDIVARVKGHE